MSKRNSSLLYPYFVKEKEDPLLAEEKKKPTTTDTLNQ